MMSKQKNSFCDQLGSIQVINKPARENLGEDSFYCAMGKQAAIVSVFDGCGGLGSRKYDTFQGHTGAYIASRIVSGAIRDWYHSNYKNSWKDIEKLSDSINEYIQKAFAVCEPYCVEKMRIRGSMVRKLPTTLALAYAESDKDGIVVHVLWAGDSRVYLLDKKGLAQLTKDDTEVEDALDNLMFDGAMTNVISSDGDYHINHTSIRLTQPTLIFSATDGCFGYIPSPMEFEYVILKSLIQSETPNMFKSKLYTCFSQYAGDDFTMGMMSFNYDEFYNVKEDLRERYEHLEKTYINILNQQRTEELADECAKNLWMKYKVSYERYLK